MSVPVLMRGYLNFLRNPRGEGAVAGTPGTMPTYWSPQSNSTGLTTTIVGTGSEANIPYLEIQLSGVAVVGVATWNIEAAGIVPAAPGQLWTAAGYYRLSAGSLANVTGANIIISELNAVGVQVQQQFGVCTPGSGTLDTCRVAKSVTLLQATTAFVRKQIQFATGAGAVNCNIRIGAPRLTPGGDTPMMVLPPVGAPGFAAVWQ